MALRYDEVTDIIKIIDASTCDELVLETGELKLILRRRGAGVLLENSAQPAAMARAASSQDSQSAALPAAKVIAVTPQAARTDSGEAAIRAPMVGTFYRAASPNAPPFVELGSEVREGMPLCVIEVMKLFTTIYAERSGRIAHIGAENGELVEYGRVLFVVDESR